jgi:hypothetical protein
LTGQFYDRFKAVSYLLIIAAYASENAIKLQFDLDTDEFLCPEKIRKKYRSILLPEKVSLVVQ